MRTDVEVCREIAAHVEDGVMQDAVILLASIDRLALDPAAHDETQEKPRLRVDLKGEDGNAYFLIAKAIHSLMKIRREASACGLLCVYTPPEHYADLVELMRYYVTLETE